MKHTKKKKREFGVQMCFGVMNFFFNQDRKYYLAKESRNTHTHIEIVIESNLNIDDVDDRPHQTMLVDNMNEWLMRWLLMSMLEIMENFDYDDHEKMLVLMLKMVDFDILFVTFDIDLYMAFLLLSIDVVVVAVHHYYRYYYYYHYYQYHPVCPIYSLCISVITE